MAQTSITSNYAGEVAAGYVAAAILSGDTIANNEINVIEGIKYQMDVQQVATANLIQSGACDFTDAGSVTITPRTLAPADMMINYQDCAKAWLQTWESRQMSAGRMNAEVPSEFVDFIVGEFAGKIGEEIEYNLWQGNTTGSSYTRFDGIEKILIDNRVDTAGGGLVAVGGGVDDTNVFAELERVYDAIPDAVIQKKADLRIYVAANVARAYRKALAADGFLDQSYVGDKPLDYLGITLVESYGMSADAMVAALKTDLHFGTDLTGDHEEVKVIDLRDLDGSENFRFVARFTGATQVTNLANVVLYHNDII